MSKRALIQFVYAVDNAHCKLGVLWACAPVKWYAFYFNVQPTAQIQINHSIDIKHCFDFIAKPSGAVYGTLAVRTLNLVC